jgi:ectoine hydroxylase-related dioxygenase (phytanoyl-CoA dioxygenase family)
MAQVGTSSSPSLTPEMLARYRRDGWIRVPHVVNGGELTALLRLVDPYVADAAAHGVRPEKLDMPHLKDPAWLAVARHPVLVRIARKLLGSDDIVLFASHLLCKPGGDGLAVPLHQDAEYWPLKPMEAVSAWVALDHVDDENGAVRFLPGSHAWGPIAHEANPGPEDSKVLHLRIPEEFRNQREFETANLSAGDCTFHHPYTIHYSRANFSTRRRAGLTLRYITRRVEIGAGWPFDPPTFELS